MSTPKPPLVPGAYRVTFPDGSGMRELWACARVATTEMQCIAIESFIQSLDETRAAQNAAGGKSL